MWTDANGTCKFSAFSPEWAPESDLITPVLRDQQWLLLYILILKNQVSQSLADPPTPHSHICHQVLSPAIPRCYTHLEQGGPPASSLKNPPGHVPSSPSLLRRPLSVEPDLVLCRRGPPSPLPALLCLLKVSLSTF